MLQDMYPVDTCLSQRFQDSKIPRFQETSILLERNSLIRYIQAAK